MDKANLEDCEEEFRIACQYKMNEIFWKTNSQRMTSIGKNRINNIITQKNENEGHKNSFGSNISERKEWKIIRNEPNEEQYIKLTKA
jgi:hypothetical protein